MENHSNCEPAEVLHSACGKTTKLAARIQCKLVFGRSFLHRNSENARKMLKVEDSGQNPVQAEGDRGKMERQVAKAVWRQQKGNSDFILHASSENLNIFHFWYKKWYHFTLTVWKKILSKLKGFWKNRMNNGLIIVSQVIRRPWKLVTFCRCSPIRQALCIWVTCVSTPFPTPLPDTSASTGLM